MAVFALIPVKKLSEAKMRLSTVLSSKERECFVLAMLKDVLKAVSVSCVDRTVLIGSDVSVRNLSSEYEAMFLPDIGGGLNHVLEHATNWCIHDGAEALLIFPADIPLVMPRDVDKIVALYPEKPSITISPSPNGGTNALMRRPPNFISTHFGNRSFKKHIDEAAKKGIIAKIYRSPRISLDIDSPQDLKRFFKVGLGTETDRFLKQKKIDERLQKLSSQVSSRSDIKRY